jgi:hypothetical protein
MLGNVNPGYLIKVSEDFQIRSSYRAPLLGPINAIEVPYFERRHKNSKRLSKPICMSFMIEHQTQNTFEPEELEKATSFTSQPSLRALIVSTALK